MSIHYSDMTISHLGPDATEKDLAEFIEICQAAEELHPEIEDITEAVFGDGDYFRNARELGVDLDAIVTEGGDDVDTAALLEAAQKAIDAIATAAEENGTTYHAAQNFYGLDLEVLVGGEDGEWVDRGDLEDGTKFTAIRWYECDGERGASCTTVAEIEAEQAEWIGLLESTCEDEE
jgi:hypothetical protein